MNDAYKGATIMNFSGLLVTATVLSLITGTFAIGAEKEKVDLPAAVKSSLDRRFPGAQLTSSEREKEEGNVVYDLELKQEGRKYEMDVKEDGTILEIEKEIKSADVPTAVTQAIGNKFPKAELKEVMEVDKVTGTEEKPDHYEVVIRTDAGKEKEVIVALDGSTIKEEAPEAEAGK
jgi:uncharacterized membrane protein YkoI